mmetsp:Transcript_50841/g.94724  ORF Transcript_50841/g.94724 Transcript_50841/m.94724 type:complete len:1715 (-) Transcript_50841:1206-6350(-)
METRGRKRDQGSGGADGRRRKHPRSDPEAARAPQLPPSNSTTTRNKTSTRTANTPVNTPRASRRASASPPSATSGADSAAAHAVSARRARAPAASPSTRNLTPNKRHPSHRAGHSQSQASASAASPPVVGGRPKGAKSKETEGGPSAADPEAMDRRHRGRNRDEDDDDDESESLSRQLAAATRGGMTSSALQGLLRKLGAGLDDLVPNASMAHSRLKHILQGLRAEGEEGRQIEALTNLCELLSIATEESLATFSVDSFVPALVGLLNAEHNPDLMLLAARALTHLADVLPPSCAAIVHYQAVPCFCARLLTIEYIDLAEQSLQALEKLSHEHPGACLRAGGLAAVLSYLDFFATGVQRVALATAANMCRQLPADAEEMVVDCVPILTNLLTYQDTKLVEQACVCLSRISESFASSPARITMLCSHGLMEQVARLVAEEGVGPVTGATWAGLVGLLATCAAGSADVSRSLLRLRVTLTMRNVLVGSGLLSPAPASPASPLLSSSHNLLPILNLLHHLLPPVPEKEAASKAAGEAGTSTVRASTRRSSSRGREEQGADDMKVESPPGREPGWWVVEEPTLLVAYGEDVLALLLQVYAVSTSGAVRHKCLSTIHRFLHYSPPAQLEALLGNMAISSFLAGLISGKDSTAALMGVTLAELLMTKLPAVFARFFLKEGVVHAMDQLAATPPPAEGWSSLSAQSTPTPSPTAASTPAGRRSHAQRSQRGQGGDVTPQGTPNQGAPPSSPHTPRPSSVRAEAVTRAQSFKRAFGSELEQHGGVTEGLAKLQSLAGALAEHKAQPARQKESLRALLAALADADGVSTFEFVGSGAAAALVRWLTAEPEGGKEEEPHAATVTRLATLWDALQETGASGALVRKLQEAVSAMESVPVQLSQGSRGGGASLSSQLAVLTQPFKLRLCRDSHDRSLRDYSSNVVLIEPLATLSAVEDFLWPRVRRPTTTTTTTPKANSNPYTAGRRSSKDKSSSGRGKSPAKDAQESPSPMTRSKAATTNSTEKKSAAENKTAAGSSGKGKAKLEAEGSAPRASRQAARSSREASGPLKTRKASRTDRDATSPRGARSLPSELELPPSHPMEECEEDDTDDDEHDFALEGMEGLDDDEEMEEEEEEEEVEPPDHLARVKWNREEESVKPWPISGLGTQLAGGPCPFYPLSDFQLSSSLLAQIFSSDKPVPPLPFPPFLLLSSNHYSLGWGARGARRLKNVVVVLDWVPDTSKLHVLPPAKHLSPEELSVLAEAAAVVGGDSDALMEAAGASPPFPLDLDAGPGAVDMAVLARIFTERPFQPIQGGRYTVVLSLAEAEAIRAMLHCQLLRGRGDTLLEGARCHLRLLSMLGPDSEPTTVLDSAGDPCAPAPPYMQGMGEAVLRMYDTQVCVDEASAECVLGAVERAPPMNRQAWVEGVAACRRRSPLALTWNKTPLRRALMTKNRLALLSVRAAVTGVKRHLAARGLGAADAFRSLDCSSRGVLTVDEMTHGWRRLGLQFTPAQSAELVDYMREPGAELDAGVTLRRWREIFGGQSESATSLDIAEVALSQGQLLASSAQADWQLTHPAEPLVSSAVGVEPRSAASGPVQVSSKVGSVPVGTSSSGGVLVEVPETILRGFKVKLVALGSLEAVWTSRGTKSRDQAAVWAGGLETSILSKNAARVCLGHFPGTSFKPPKPVHSLSLTDQKAFAMDTTQSWELFGLVCYFESLASPGF